MNLKIFALLLFLIGMSGNYYLNANENSTKDYSSKQNELKAIEEEISYLTKKIASSRKKALNAETNAQTYMIEDWHHFAEDIQLEEKFEQQIDQLQKRLQYLSDRKEILLKSSLSN